MTQVIKRFLRNNDGNIVLPYTLTSQVLMNDDVTTLSEELEESKYLAKVTTSNEVNNITTDVNKQARVNLYGNTLVNLLSNDGDCEDISRWLGLGTSILTLDSNNKVFGNNGIKITQNTGVNWSEMGKNVSGIIDKTKYYCLSAYVKNGTATSVYALTADVNGAVISASTYVADTTKFNRTFVKLKPSDLTNVVYVSVGTNGTAGSQYAYVDGVMLEEITLAQYNDANFTPSLYVYNDVSVGEVTTRVKTRGKNLLNLVQGTIDTIGKPVASTLRLSHANGIIPVKPNTTYTVSLDKPLFVTFPEWDANRYRAVVNPWDSTAVTSYTFTTKANTAYITPLFKINDSSVVYAGDYKIQLEEGSIATTYEPYQETYLNIGQPLRSLPSGVQDTIEDGKLIKRVDKIVLDGTLGWLYNSNYTGYKEVYIPNLIPNSVGQKGRLLKYNNKEVACVSAYTGSDQFVIPQNNNIGVTIPSVDSGWSDSYTPTSAEIQAYFYGWKMYDNVNPLNLYTSGTKAWVRTNAIVNGVYNDGGIISTTNTLPTIQSYGYTPYRLYYQLATPIITELSFSNLVAYPNGKLIIESDSQNWVKPTITYQIIDNLKGNLDVLEKGLSDSSRQIAKYMSDTAQLGNPNLLINGDFKVWQRGTSFSSVATYAYTADRWYSCNMSGFDVTKTSNGIKCSRSGTGYVGIGQPLLMSELSNTLKGKEVTLSMDLVTLTGITGIVFYVRDITNSVTLVGSTVSIIGRNSVTFTVPNNCDNMLIEFFQLSSSTGTSSFEINRVKLEVGNKATPFIPRLYAEELAMCMRYYRSLQSLGILALNLTDGMYFHVPTSTVMRVQPTIVNPASIQIYNTANGSQGGFTFSVSGHYGSTISVVGTKTAHGLTGGYIVLPNGTGFDAEIY